MARSAGTREDSNHPISILQAPQIGATKCSIDRLSRSIGRSFLEHAYYPQWGWQLNFNLSQCHFQTRRLGIETGEYRQSMLTTKR
jgi:hypothetical protein